MYNKINKSNNVNPNFGVKKMDQNIPKNFQEQVDITVANLLKRSEREVPEYGDFAPVMEFFDNLSKKTNTIVGRYGLQIYKMPKDVVEDPKQRFIEAAAYTPSGRHKSKMVVGSGTKSEIMNILKDPEFASKLNNTYGKLLKILREA